MGQLTSAMFPNVNQQQQQQPEDVPWMLKYSARIVGAVGSAISIALGIWTCVSIYPLCIVAGIFQILASFIVLLIEAPCCCFFLEHVQQLSSFADSKPYWQKALFYLILSLPAIILCQGLSTFFGCGLIFATAVLYGMMALGKKASREEMMARASSTSKVTLVDSTNQAVILPRTTSEPLPP